MQSFAIFVGGVSVSFLPPHNSFRFTLADSSFI
jgi:hypothetical protein